MTRLLVHKLWVQTLNVIAELGLAIEAGMNAEDIALTVHAHPTLGEMSMEAAEKSFRFTNSHNVIIVE